MTASDHPSGSFRETAPESWQRHQALGTVEVVPRDRAPSSLEALAPTAREGQGPITTASSASAKRPRTPAEAVALAKPSFCPNAPARWVWDVSSNRVHQLACGRWSCKACGAKKRAAAHIVFSEGMNAALARGERVRFMTLTDGSTDGLDMTALYAAWNRLRTALKRPARRGGAPRLNQYAAVVEATEGGRLHLHVVATGAYIPQSDLSKLAARAGFGRVCDIRPVAAEDVPRFAQYLADYLSKASKKRERFAAVEDAAATRVRPVRTSRGWGMSMRGAEKVVVQRWIAERGGKPKEDTGQPSGPWVLLTRREDAGAVTAYLGSHELSQDEFEALATEADHPDWVAEGWRAPIALDWLHLVLGLDPPRRPWDPDAPPPPLPAPIASIVTPALVSADPEAEQLSLFCEAA